MVVIVDSRITLALQLFKSIIWCRNKFIRNLKLLNVAVTLERPGIYRFDGTSWPFPSIFLVRNSSTLSPFKFYMFVFQRSSRNSSRYLSTRYVKCSFNVIQKIQFLQTLPSKLLFVHLHRSTLRYPSRSKTRKLMCSHPPILKYQHLEIKLHSSKLSFIHLYRSSLRYRYSQVDKFHRQFSNNIWIKFFQAFLCSVTSIKLIFQINKFYHQCSYSQIISESNSTFVHLHVSRERKRIEKQVTR